MVLAEMLSGMSWKPSSDADKAAYLVGLQKLDAAVERLRAKIAERD